MNTGREYFVGLYDADPDPWGFATSAYEARKYDITVASLPRPRYRSGFEPGCSVGVLTARLAARCDRLLATDILPGPLDAARRRLAGEDHVRFEQWPVPDRWPPGTFDLIVLSEVAYYFDGPSLERLLGAVLDSLEPGGSLVAVHWRGPTDYPLTGDAVHDRIAAGPGLTGVCRHLEAAFVLDVWTRDTGA